jgi:hypothetical protein
MAVAHAGAAHEGATQAGAAQVGAAHVATGAQQRRFTGRQHFFAHALSSATTDIANIANRILTLRIVGVPREGGFIVIGDGMVFAHSDVAARKQYEFRVPRDRWQGRSPPRIPATTPPPGLSLC